MPRIVSTTFMLFWAVLVIAQGRGLEGEFGKLSAKERSRIAQVENDEAYKDARYQAVMAEAENLFRDQSYDAALERFHVARDLRPYNVYPRVKIQDLQALIERRDAALAMEVKEKEDTVGHVERTNTGIAATTEGRPSGGGLLEQAVDSTSAPATVRPLPTRTDRKPVPAPTEVGSGSLPSDRERVYKEGRAVVVERSTVVDGKAVVFRKVLHPYGDVMYFRDGLAISERVWLETFGAH